MRIAATVLMLGGSAFGQVIDLETLPDGSTPADDQPLPLETPYVIDGIEVSLGLDTDGDGVPDLPVLFEAVGEDGTDAFLNGTDGLFDTARPPFVDQLGSFFLKYDGSAQTRDLVIDYGSPVSAASGEIWDIDRAVEQWRIVAYDSGGTVLREVISVPGTGSLTPLDGEPWIFALAAPGITKIVVEFVGTPTLEVGLAFDNFRATSALPGPTLLTHQPDLPITDPAGVTTARLYWSEPVTIGVEDLAVTLADASGLPVPFSVAGSGTQVTTITFLGEPGGLDAGAPVPLLLGSYLITVRDSARASANNAPIDGDADGISGGDASALVRHDCNIDFVEPFGQLDLRDVTAFVERFLDNCEN